MKKKIILLTVFTCIFFNSTQGIWVGCDWNASTNTAPYPDQLHKNQKDEKKLKEQLNDLEGEIFKKKYLSLMNPIRDKTAFLIAIVGLCGSFIIPFKVVKKDNKHPFKTAGKRFGVMSATLGATAITTLIVTFFKPTLWYQQYRRENVKKKIFDLQKNSPQPDIQKATNEK